MKGTEKRFDAGAFFGGTDSEAYRFLGAHRARQGGEEGYLFRLWAPNAARVSVVGDFCAWDAGAYPMARSEHGLWERFILGLKQFDAYKYAVTSAQGKTVLKADPYAFHAETRPGTASKLYDLPPYRWGDGAWRAGRASAPVDRSPLNIYEVHLGSWRRRENGDFYEGEHADGTPDGKGRMKYADAKAELLRLTGVGVKVAECICLFGLHHIDAFPVDTHIRQMLDAHYPKGFPLSRYKGFAGVMQQYAFYYELQIQNG